MLLAVVVLYLTTMSNHKKMIKGTRLPKGAYYDSMPKTSKECIRHAFNNAIGEEVLTQAECQANAAMLTARYTKSKKSPTIPLAVDTGFYRVGPLKKLLLERQTGGKNYRITEIKHDVWNWQTKYVVDSLPVGDYVLVGRVANFPEPMQHSVAIRIFEHGVKWVIDGVDSRTRYELSADVLKRKFPFGLVDLFNIALVESVAKELV